MNQMNEQSEICLESDLWVEESA